LFDLGSGFEGIYYSQDFYSIILSPIIFSTSTTFHPYFSLNNFAIVFFPESGGPTIATVYVFGISGFLHTYFFGSLQNSSKFSYLSNKKTRPAYSHGNSVFPAITFPLYNSTGSI